MVKTKTTFHDSTGKDLRYVNGHYGRAMQQHLKHVRERGNLQDKYWEMKQFSETAAMLPFGKKENIMTSGSAILVTYFLQGLFATDKWHSVEMLANIANKQGYACWNKRPRYEDVVGRKWFDHLHEITGLTSTEVFDAEEVINTLSRGTEVTAYVLQVRNDWLYGNKELGGSHYLVLMGVDLGGAMVYDSRTGVNTDRTLKQILEAAVRVWSVTE